MPRTALKAGNPSPWQHDDFAILDDEIVVGRMYREQLPAGLKWMWFLHIMGASPNSGTADTLDEAKAGIAEAYERCRHE
jgi:hypothetical protein